MNLGIYLSALKTPSRRLTSSCFLVPDVHEGAPWLIFEDHGGSAGLLSGGKGGTYEGGMREPAIFWYPGTIKPEVVMDLGTTMDLLPTFCALADVELPVGRTYDGFDLFPVLSGTGDTPREVVYYYRGTQIYAIRKGEFKAHYITQGEYGGPKRIEHNPPLLFNLYVDPSEKVDIAEKHPEVLLEFEKLLTEHRAGLIPVENQLEK